MWSFSAANLERMKTFHFLSTCNRRKGERARELGVNRSRAARIALSDGAIYHVVGGAGQG
jgi:hypothetical protein